MNAPDDDTFPRFVPAGDAAIVVELGRVISRSLNERVQELDEALRDAAFPEVIATVPTYASLLVYYDSGLVLFGELVIKLRSLAAAGRRAKRSRRRWMLPVCYGGEIGFDLEALARLVKLPATEVVALHAAVEYMVYMIGFSPGFAYLGELPAALGVPRKSALLPEIPPGTIQIGGVQTAISSMPMPTGWYIVGRTPAMMYDARRPRPFLLEAGDYVRFAPIVADEFHALTAAADRGDFIPESSPA
jgi:KipI family sensor histidine kinase inhibitor